MKHKKINGRWWRCKAIASSTGKRCRNTAVTPYESSPVNGPYEYDPPVNDYCFVHGPYKSLKELIDAVSKKFI